MVEINLNTLKPDSVIENLPELPAAMVTNPVERIWVRIRVIKQLFDLFRERLGNPLKAT
jgi:hypothetical protein